MNTFPLIINAQGVREMDQDELQTMLSVNSIEKGNKLCSALINGTLNNNDKILLSKQVSLIIKTGYYIPYSVSLILFESQWQERHTWDQLWPVEYREILSRENFQWGFYPVLILDALGAGYEDNRLDSILNNAQTLFTLKCPNNLH